MPFLSGFSDNPFKTRSDFIRGGAALIRPLEQYRSPGKAKVKIPTATGAHFSEHSAQLEGFARPLWLLANLFDQFQDSPSDLGIDLGGWVTGIRNGVDPASTEYWGDLIEHDQRMVEMESIAYTLLTTPKTFAFEDDPAARANLVAWLSQINGKSMPKNNWRWFRVFVNLALTKSLGVPLARVQECIKDDFDILDTFYLGDGWNSDGAWCAERKQADYYSGSFAIQFAQLLYVRLAPDFDSKRTQRYKDQARQFSTGFWRYFSPQGAAIPFGRSLTYRFAFAGFWAACAQAEVHLPAPLDNPGAVKGMLLRHLRWWSCQEDMFNIGGSLSIGYTYPNSYVSEDYNSPQSVYWCVKSFIAAGLPEDHPFWTSEEEQYPLKVMPHLGEVSLLERPRQILCNTPEHHFLLSTGQHTDVDHKAKESKYGKLAYSSAFGLSVSVAGQSLKNLAPDSTLALSYDGGKCWKVLWDPYSQQVGSIQLGGETVPNLRSTYKPFNHLDVEVVTTLIPPVRKFPGWHLRTHQIRCSASAIRGGALNQLRCVDSGFSISGVSSHGIHISESPCHEDGDALLSQVGEGVEGWWKTANSSLIQSESGISGVLNLTKPGMPGSASVQTEGTPIKPHANTNIMIQRTLIPSITHVIDFTEISETALGEYTTFNFITGIFAVDERVSASLEVLNMWHSLSNLRKVDF